LKASGGSLASPWKRLLTRCAALVTQLEASARRSRGLRSSSTRSRLRGPFSATGARLQCGEDPGTSEWGPEEVPQWLLGLATDLEEDENAQGSCLSPLLHAHRRSASTGYQGMCEDLTAFIVTPPHGTFLSCGPHLSITLRAAVRVSMLAPQELQLQAGGRIVVTQRIPPEEWLMSGADPEDDVFPIEAVVPVTSIAWEGDAPVVLKVKLVGEGDTVLAASEIVLEVHSGDKGGRCKHKAPTRVPPRLEVGKPQVQGSQEKQRAWFGEVVGLQGGGEGYNAVERRVWSQHGEDGVVLAILEDIQLGVDERVYVEIGTEDGTQCNSRVLREGLAGKEWRGFMFDNTYENASIGLIKETITPGATILTPSA